MDAERSPAPLFAPQPAEEMALDFPALAARLAACRRCHAAGHAVAGLPLRADRGLPAPIYVLGQAPAAVHAERPSPPFSPGRHGQPSPLWGWLERAGWSEPAFRQVAYFTAITRCYPGPAPSGQGDRRPSAGEQRLCRPYWQRELLLADPQVIVTLGTMALHALGFRRLRLRDAVGRVYDLAVSGRERPVVPLPHPSGVSRWLNDSAHQRLLERGLAHLDRLTLPLRESEPYPTN